VIYAGNSPHAEHRRFGLLVEFLRADNSVLASQTLTPRAWASESHNLDAGLVAACLTRATAAAICALKSSADYPFAGEIDHIKVDSTPEPGGSALPVKGLAAMAWFVARRRASLNSALL